MGVLFEELTALEALQAAGIPTSMYVGKSWASVVELLKSAGYAKLSNGLWASGELLTGAASTSAGTALATTTNVGAIEVLTGDAVLAADGSVAAYLGGTGASAATVGSSTAAAGAITLTPKTAVIAAVATACGLALAYDTGQWIGSEFFDGADFDWSKDSIGGKVITLLTGDGKTYIDEDLANRIKDRLIEIGAFDDGSFVIPESVDYNNLEIFNLQAFFGYYINHLKPNDGWRKVLELIMVKVPIKDLGGYIEMSIVTRSNNTFSVEFYISNSKSLYGNSKPYRRVNNRYFSGNPWYGYETSRGNHGIVCDHAYRYVITGNFNSGVVNYTESEYNENVSIQLNTAFTVTITNIGNYTEGGLPGVSKQPNATYPSSNPLSQTYPSWINSGNKIFAGDDNDVNKKINMIPISIPADGESSKPQSDAQTGTNTDESIKEQIDSQEEVSQETNIDPSIKIPTDDTGDLPIAPVPAVGIPGTGFVAIYNPTQSQLASFSQYLWSDNFIANIKKLFEDPMQAIIGLHMIYATPSRGADHNIVCGYLDSGVNSRTVSNQYINIACGAIKVSKYFGNILDYAPYTKIQLFLPFIGVVSLDTNEVMGSTLNVTYRVDVLTGACLAQVSVSRSDYGAVMYTFSGNCAVQLPITGGNYSSIIANTIGIGASIGATIASGGALAPVAVAGAAAGVSNSHLNVAHSGSIGANAGAMGGKIPYLIITRPKPYNANNYNNFYGYPSNKTIKLSSCTGYTRVKDIHLENISSATDDELNEIESLLKEGVII